jgi:hypothetical protein
MNGSPLAKIAYLRDKKWTTVGRLIYFRSHEVRIKLNVLPLWAMMNKQWMLGTFVEQFKVAEPPYLDGDVIVKTEDGDQVIGKLITYQNETGTVTHYMVQLSALPAAKVVQAMKEAEVDKKSIWLDIRLEDQDV